MSARISLALLSTVAGLAGATPALALAVIDGAVLSQKTDTKGSTVKLVPIQSNTKDQTDGIKCAVTTGQQGNVSDPAKPANPTQGRSKAQLYGPDLPANWQPPTTGSTGSSGSSGSTGSTQNREVATGNFGRNQELGTAGDVIGGLMGSEETIPATTNVYRQQAGTIGQSKTIQGSWDQNSGLRVQNALTWNQSTNALNLFVQALNLANLMRANDMSRAATALGSAMPAFTAGSGFGGQPIACAPGQIVNPSAGAAGAPPCLDARSPNTDPATAESLARFQASAKANAAGQ